MNYLVSFFNGLHFGHAVCQLDKLDEESIDYIVSELKKAGEESVVIISITRLEG